jgi:hypothetical protein
MMGRLVKQVFVAQHKIDFRRGVSGLLAEAYAMELDPYEGECLLNTIKTTPQNFTPLAYAQHLRLTGDTLSDEQRELASLAKKSIAFVLTLSHSRAVFLNSFCREGLPILNKDLPTLLSFLAQLHDKFCLITLKVA